MSALSYWIVVMMSEHSEIGGFHPGPWTRNPHLQSIFASLNWRALGRNPMVDCSREMIIKTDEGVRLLSYYSPQPGGKGKGLVTLIHGWEGSSNSTYILSTGRYLFKQGYDILRLNMRDHGESHRLNEGMFHSALIEEVFNACRKASSLSGERPFVIVGFSLGGNFSMRIALRHSAEPIPNLKRVVAISPVLDPYKATIRIDQGSLIYGKYFLRKWKTSLKKKQALFPRKYDFTGVLQLKSCLEITDKIVPRYTPFRNSREYFDQYTLLGGAFNDLLVPLFVITSEDDPIIEGRDFHNLRGNENLELAIHRYGGHCGFLDPFPFGCWYEKKIYNLLENLKTKP